MDILLARHAESIANTQGIYQGQTYDTPLSDKGVKQAISLAKILSKFKIDQVYSSPLARTLQTAQTISERLISNPPITDKRILEINHGDWEGKTKEQIEQEFPGQLAIWKTNPETITMPNGENLKQVYERSLNLIKEVSQEEHNRIVLVTHDAVIRVVLTKLLMRELNDLWIYRLDAAGYSTLEWNGKFKQVVKINENEHLKGLASDLTAHAL